MGSHSTAGGKRDCLRTGHESFLKKVVLDRQSFDSVAYNLALNLAMSTFHMIKSIPFYQTLIMLMRQLLLPLKRISWRSMTVTRLVLLISRHFYFSKGFCPATYRAASP